LGGEKFNRIKKVGEEKYREKSGKNGKGGDYRKETTGATAGGEKDFEGVD